VNEGERSVIGQRWRIVTLAAGAAGMLMVFTGTALAGAASAASTQTYTNSVIGPISSESVCAADSAAENNLPDQFASACRFSATYPGSSVSDPGWYYNLHVLITP
jgi:hypothetical protein